MCRVIFDKARAPKVDSLCASFELRLTSDALKICRCVACRVAVQVVSCLVCVAQHRCCHNVFPSPVFKLGMVSGDMGGNWNSCWIVQPCTCILRAACRNHTTSHILVSDFLLNQSRNLRAEHFYKGVQRTILEGCVGACFDSAERSPFTATARPARARDLKQ